MQSRPLPLRPVSTRLDYSGCPFERDSITRAPAQLALESADKPEAVVMPAHQQSEYVRYRLHGFCNINYVATGPVRELSHSEPSGPSTVTTCSRCTRTSRGVLEVLDSGLDLLLELTLTCLTTRTPPPARPGATLRSTAQTSVVSAMCARPLIACRLEVEKVNSAIPYSAGSPSQNLLRGNAAHTVQNGISEVYT